MLRLPSEVRFGLGSRSAVCDIVLSWGTRVLVVTDPFLATTEEFRVLMEALESRRATVLVDTDVPVEVPVDAIHRAAQRAREFAPDALIGYGGGTALDAAKLLALLLAHHGPLSRFYGENLVPGPVLPILALPTTAGTGSEVTPVAVVSDPDRELKVGISSPHLIPRVAIVDPELTVGAPPSVTRFAGIDAFVHAVECFTARELAPTSTGVVPVFVGRNTLADPIALEAVTLIHRALPRAVDDGSDIEARVDMARGSLLAGIAFGATGTHASHAIQYAVGARTHTAHGLGTGTLLPFVLELCARATPARVARLGAAMGLEAGGGDEHAARAAVDEVAAFCERVGLPSSLAPLGLDSGDRDQIVDLTKKVTRLLGLAPFATDDPTLSGLVAAALSGDRASLRASAEGSRLQETS